MFALLVVALGESNACFHLTIVEQVILVAHGKPLGCYVGLVIIDKNSSYVEYIVGHVVLVNLVHRIVKEVISFLNIATCNHNLGLQIKTVEVELVGNHVSVVLRCVDVFVVDKCYAPLEHQWHSGSRV